MSNTRGVIYVAFGDKHRQLAGMEYALTNLLTPGSGAAAGYVSSYQVRLGQSGTLITTRSFTYTSNTAGGVTVTLPATTVRAAVAEP